MRAEAVERDADGREIGVHYHECIVAGDCQTDEHLAFVEAGLPPAAAADTHHMDALAPPGRRLSVYRPRAGRPAAVVDAPKFRLLRLFKRWPGGPYNVDYDEIYVMFCRRTGGVLAIGCESRKLWPGVQDPARVNTSWMEWLKNA